MIRMFLVLIAASGLLLDQPALGAAQDRGAANETVLVDVPMLFRGTSPAVEVLVNGRGPFLFLIDTGAQGAARADTMLVEQLSLRPVGTSLVGDGSGQNDRTLERYRFTVRLGRLTFRDVEGTGRNYNRSPRLPTIAGILGFDLFADHLLTLDFANRRVRVSRGALPEPDGRTVIPFSMPFGTPLIHASIGGFQSAADIDTGDVGTISLPTTLARVLQFASEPRPAGTGMTVSNEFTLTEVTLTNTLRIGAHETRRPVVTYYDLLDNINLGAGFFAGKSITFDQRNRRVRIVAPE